MGSIDGGVYANNPAMCAYVEARKLQPDTDVLVASLGTGQYTRPIHYKEAKDWGLAQWAKPILDVVFDGVSDTVDHQMKTLCRRERVTRATSASRPKLNIGSDDMDNATATNIAALKQKAQELVKQQSAALDRLCKELTGKATKG